MAGVIRQPIDVDSFSRYIKKHVPEIKLPIDIKQVNLSAPHHHDLPS